MRMRSAPLTIALALIALPSVSAAAAIRAPAYVARGATLLIAVLLLSSAAPAARAATPPPAYGPADGVAATRATDGTVELRFTGAAAALDGRKLDVECAPHPTSDGLLFVASSDIRSTFDGPYAATGTVSAAGVLRVKLGTRRAIDACDVSDGPRLVARAALDPAGVVWVDEAPRALALRDLLSRARTATAYRPAAALTGGAVVALDGPEAIAPAGQLGYWTDGAAHAVATTTSATGRPLRIEDLGDAMLRTDVFDQGAVLDPVMSAVFSAILFGALARSGPSQRPSRSPYRGKPVDRGDGVRAHLAGGRLSIAFTGRSAVVARTLAGRRVRITCVTRPARALFGGALRGPVIHGVNARMRGGVRTLRAALRGGDVCLVRDGERLVATALATDAGRRWWADTQAIGFLDRLPDSLAAPGGQAYLTPAAIVAGHRDLVALSGPGAKAPAGRVGVWTDGARSAVVAATSASGRRLVLADEGGGTLRTNVFGDLLGLALFDDTLSTG